MTTKTIQRLKQTDTTNANDMLPTSAELLALLRDDYDRVLALNREFLVALQVTLRAIKGNNILDSVGGYFAD